MKTGRRIVNVLMVAVLAIAVACVTAGRVQAETVALTSVDQLDFANVVKAYDFTRSADNGVFDIGGVTFTRHSWTASNPHTFDGLTLSGNLVIDSQGSSAADIVLGGTAQDRANLNALLDWWNIGGQGATPMDLSIVVPNGTYKVQFIVGNHPTVNRYSELFDTNAGTPGVSLGYFYGGGNWLITGNVVVSDGTLNLRLADYVPGTGGDDRRVMSGLIINSAAAPPSVGGTVAVKTVLLEVTGFVGYKQ